MKYPSHYRVREKVSELHAAALADSLGGNYESAAERYGELQKLLDEPADWAVLALSRVTRDAAMNTARLGIAERDQSLVISAANAISKAHVSVDDLIAAEDVSAEALAHLHDENGATHGVRARIATVKMVQALLWREPYSFTEECAAEAESAYVIADGHLLQGGNYYYRVSNAANFARHHAARGEHHIQVARWLSVAGKRAVTAAFSDPGNSNSA